MLELTSAPQNTHTGTLQTDDGALIQIRNKGLRHGPPEVMARLKAIKPDVMIDIFKHTMGNANTAAGDCNCIG